MPNGRVCVLAVESCGGFSWACTRRPVTPVLWSLKWFFVALDSSHGVLSVIFRILGKFWIDIGVKKNVHRKMFRRKKPKIIFENVLVEKVLVEKNLAEFRNFRHFGQNEDFRDFEIFEILEIFESSKNFQKISFRIFHRPNK